MKEHKTLRSLFWVIDSGFIIYWAITFSGLIPSEYLYNDYSNPLLVDWNWSFFPLDTAISITGFSSLYLRNRQKPIWLVWAIISLTLTFCSGLQAVSFWGLRGDFSWIWWLPNLFLMAYPIIFIPRLLQKSTFR
ncbi:DUF5360 family protein [Runella slithyformis]|uniref:YvaD family protein n=1 Tax=Runella slithyformis (strain ATCC 29530 / DSM 19594 / LMG 11500 / NCIMB 11436 / LSU 4) TaxID=761193 RepID=A0A7U3ZMP6_RUNSL|nr:DUF5360 family protein [Runella slithyformis]AEI50047.1 YvaD family protein [Runella slithyformis DSM 19594]